MGYNQRNLLMKIVEIQNITLAETKQEKSQKWVYENLINPRFSISIATYNNYLSCPAKRKLKEMESEK